MSTNISRSKKFETSTIADRWFVRKNGQGLGKSHQVNSQGPISFSCPPRKINADQTCFYFKKN